MSDIPKYIIKRMIPQKGVNIKDDKIELTYLNLMHHMPVKNLSPLSVEILIDEEEADPFQTTLVIDPQEDPLPPGGKLIFSFPNTFGIKQGETHKVSFEWFGGNVKKIELERVIGPDKSK